MNLNELREVVKDVLKEQKFFKPQPPQRKMLPRDPAQPAKDTGVPEKKYNPVTDNRIDATSDEAAKAELKALTRASGPVPGKRYVAKDVEGYFIRTLVDTRGT